MALCCRQSAVSPRAHGLTNARWQLVHGDSDLWRPKTIAQRCGAAIAAFASAGSTSLTLLKILSFGNDRANSMWSQAQHTGEKVTIVETVWGKAPGLLEGLKKRFCDFEISRLETLGKAVVDRLKKRYRISGTALILQQPGEARGGAQLPG